MSFLGSLAKGVVRSAVNQVGRDGGRVISNHLYGDSHAAPIRGASSSSSYVIEEDIPHGEEKNKLIEMGYHPKYYFIGHFQFFFYGIILTLFTGGFFGVVPLIRGIHKYTRKKVTYSKKSLVAVYTPDRRYKSGGRYAGAREDELEVKIPATGLDLENVRKAAMRDIIFGALGCILFVVAYISVKKSKGEL